MPVVWAMLGTKSDGTRGRMSALTSWPSVCLVSPGHPAPLPMPAPGVPLTCKVCGWVGLIGPPLWRERGRAERRLEWSGRVGCSPHPPEGSWSLPPGVNPTLSGVAQTSPSRAWRRGTCWALTSCVNHIGQWAEGAGTAWEPACPALPGAQDPDSPCITCFQDFASPS